MSRHRNVRTMNVDDVYFDEDDVYGHSVEDNYCISPGTAAQFTFNRDRNVDLSSFMQKEDGIPEEEEEEEEGETNLHGSQDYTPPSLNDLDTAKLNSCLEEIRNVLGETVPEHILVETIMKNDFQLEVALNELLTIQDAPKPKREPRLNRRSRSHANTENTAPPQDSDPPVDTALLNRPTVILKQPPKPKVQAPGPPTASEPAEETAVSDRNLAEDLLGVDRTPSKLTAAGVTSSGSCAGSPESVKKQKQSVASADVGTSSGDLNLTPKKERFIPPLPKSSSKSKYEKVDLKEEYKKRQGEKDMLNLVIIGHVDAGKSTLMGHLLYQLGSVNKRLMHKYEQESRKLGKGSFAFAWVLDETEEERTRGVTMDIAQTKFETEKKSITLLDAPGHKDFIPNMITGTAQADVAILVVNATNGEFETGFDSGGQTREHALLARSLGVSQLVVAVNKMDTVDWSESRYREVVSKLGQFLKQAGFKESDTSFIPVSGLSGENLVKPVQEPKLAAWYQGNTLARQIDEFKPVPRAIDKPLRICIADVFKGMGSGLTVLGKLASGCVQVGDRVLVLPAWEMAVVKGISINDDSVGYAFAGDHVSVVITGVDMANVVIGSVLCDVRDPMKCAVRLRARVVLFNLEVPITRGFMVNFHYQSITEPAVIKKLVSQLNKSTGEIIKSKPKCLTKNTSAVIEVEFEHPVCMELYKDNKELGRFMLRYSGHTIAAGLVEEILKTKFEDSQGAGTLGST